MLVGAAAAVYPNLLVSTTDPALNITVYNAHSGEHSLAVGLIWWGFRDGAGGGLFRVRVPDVSGEGVGGGGWALSRKEQAETGVTVTRRVFLGSLSLPLAVSAAESPVGCQENAWVLKAGDFPGLLEVFRKAKALGYVGVECNIRFVQDQFARAAEARKEMEATGVQFIGAHTSMANSKSDAFAKTAAGVAALGALRMVMSSMESSPGGMVDPAALKAKAAEMDRLGKVCQQNGIRMAYHNHNPEFANHNAEIQALAENTNPELVDFLMDAGHGYLGGGDPAEFMARNSKRIFGCHVKTFRGKEQQVPLGEGDFGFEALAAAMKKTGWKGWIIPEEGGNPRYANSAALGPDRQYIRKIFGV